MKVLRLLFLLAVIASATLTAARAPWQARLLVGMTAFIIDLDRAPIWSPPKGPTYDQFRRTFPNDGSAHDNIPPARTPGLVIRPVLKWDQAIVEFLLYLWPVTVLFSAAYLAFRGPRRDIVFHCVLGVAIGLTCGAAFCLGILLLFGGWGPPWPEWFGLAGLGFGLFLALLDWSVGKVG